MTLMSEAARTLRHYRSEPVVVNGLGYPFDRDNYAYVLAELIVSQVGLGPGYAWPIAGDLLSMAGVRTLTVIEPMQQVLECTHPECEVLATHHGDQGAVCPDHHTWINERQPSTIEEILNEQH